MNFTIVTCHKKKLLSVTIHLPKISKSDAEICVKIKRADTFHTRTKWVNAFSVLKNVHSPMSRITRFVIFGIKYSNDGGSKVLVGCKPLKKCRKPCCALLLNRTKDVVSKLQLLTPPN